MILFTFLQTIPLGLACDMSERELLQRIAKISSKETQSLGLPDTGITHREFNRIIDSVKKVYGPIFKNLHQRFKIESSWEDPQMNAFAGLRGYERYIVLYGGFARHPLMTPDAYLSIVCHEIGHHLGGFPKKMAGSWSSSEGQADYFSTLKCMKEVLGEANDNTLVGLSLDLPLQVKAQCLLQFPNVYDYSICLRSSKAAEDHGRVLSDIDTKAAFRNVSLMTPSTNHVSVTNLKHPDAQCRLDTQFQGALCNVMANIPLDNDDENRGTCSLNNFDVLGARPGCWFVHKK